MGKVLVAKPDSLNLILRTHVVEVRANVNVRLPSGALATEVLAVNVMLCIEGCHLTF